LGLRSREDAEVIDGLKAGETIVLPTDPGSRLTDGRRIVTP
jgi:hypothetical protein